MRRLALAVLAVVSLGCLGLAREALSQTLPTMRFERGALVSPSAAQTYYGTSTTRTSSFTGVSGFEGRPPEIVEQVRALGNDVDLIHEYVRNHIDVEFAFGLRKGALGAMIDKSGTPFDINVLFVELVRQAGYTARYRVGNATLNATQFSEWTGLTNADAACRMLAYAGIPASVNGSSPASCGLSGSVTSVVIRHVWTEVTIGGTWYVFDPSFKAHNFAARRNLETDAGFVAGAAAAQAGSGISSGTLSGQAFISNANGPGLDAYLTARSTALLNTLRSQAFAADLRDVIGGPRILPSYSQLRVTTTPYTSSVHVTLTGDIPDQYRTGLHIAASTSFGTFARQLWVDQIYGRRLEFDSNFDAEHITAPQHYFNLSFRLELDDVSLNEVTNPCGGPQPGCLPSFTYSTTITVNHPYAASSGGYADQVITGNGTGAVPVAIAHGWGQVSPRLESKWGSERAEDESLPRRVAGGYSCEPPEELCNPTYASPAGDMSRQRTTASWLAQFSRMLQLQRQVGNSEIQHHHSVGLVQWNYGWQTFQVGPTGPYDFGISDQMLTIDLRSAVSVSHRTGDLNRERAVSRSVALAGAMLEGSVVEQLQDLPDAASTAARLAWANAPDEDNCAGGPRRFMDFTGASSGTVSGLMLFEGQNEGCSASLPITVGSRQAMKTAAATTINQYLAGGFSVTGTQESFLGPGARLGLMSTSTMCPLGQCSTTTSFEASLHRGGAVIANKVDGSGNVLEVAHAVLVMGTISKGGGGAQPEVTATTFDPRRAADVLRDRFVDRSSVHGVNLADGTVGHTTRTLLSAGSDNGLPYRLEYLLSFQGGPACSGEFGPCTGPTQGGWTHNWDIRFTLGASGLEAMGVTTPLRATDALLAVMAMQDTFMQTGIANMRRDVYAALMADWWRRRMVGNAATVTKGFQGEQYVRLADNTWQPPVGKPGTLTQIGARAKVRDLCSPNPAQIQAFPATARRWNFASVTFSLRNPNGDTMAFAPWSGAYTTNPCMILYGYRVTSWSWPQSPTLTFTSSQGQVIGLTSSLGRSMTGLAGYVANIGSRSAGLTVSDTKLTDSAGAQWTYAYTAPVARSATQRPRPYAQIYRISEPVNPTQPALEYTYDSLGRVKEARDAVALQATRNPHVFYIAERARSRRTDPAGGHYTVYYDVRGDAIRFIDEIGRLSTAEYDGRHRVTSRTYPEGDKDVFGYDTRDNLSSLVRNPKPGSPLDPITMSASYETSWNRIATFTDGRGNTTSFSYHASGNGAGQLATVVRPAIPSGTATYAFGYNAIGLVTSEVDPTGRTNTHAYNGSGDRTSTTFGTAAVEGNPALNNTANFTPDSWGDYVVETDPRNNARSITFDAARRPTVVRHHNGGTGSGLLAARRTTYDLLGRVTQIDGATVTSGPNVTTWKKLEGRTYTPTGQLHTLENGAGNLTVNAYDALDRLSQVTDPVSRITRNEYDAASQLLKMIRAYGTPLQQDYATYTYTPNGLQASVRDANNNRSFHVYDGFDRLCRLYFPIATLGANQAATGGIAESALTCASGGTNPDFEGYGYDKNNNRTSLRVRTGQTIAFTFDALNRQTVKDIPGSTAADVYTAYDLAGRILFQRFESESGAGLSMLYDARGRLRTETTFGQAVRHGYDAASNRTRLTWPDDQFVSWIFDAMNRMTQVRQGASTVLVSLEYDKLGRRSKHTRANGAVTDLGYDDASRLTSLNHDLPGTADDQHYGFSYTPASQVQSRSASNDGYTWQAPAASKSYVRDGRNRYTSISGVSITHDGRGNLTGDGSRTLGYDLENRLLSVSGPASLTLSYDPAGRLRQIQSGTTTQLLYAGNQLVGEYNGATLLRRYAHGPGLDEPVVWFEGSGFSDPRYLIADRQGSIVAVNGASTTRHRYGPYGEPEGWAGSRFRYTGQIVLPEASLYHYKARVYDPVLGRFLQTDPVGYADDLNLHQYAHNDPVQNTDPSGEAVPVVVAGCATNPPCVAAVAAVAIVAGQAIADLGKAMGDAVSAVAESIGGLFSESKSPSGERASESDQPDSGESVGPSDRSASPALRGDPYSPQEVDKRRSETRRQEGAPSNDPDSPIPDRGAGSDQGGHDSRARTPHSTGERNVNPNEEHSRRPKGNPIGRPRR